MYKSDRFRGGLQPIFSKVSKSILQNAAVTFRCGRRDTAFSSSCSSCCYVFRLAFHPNLLHYYICGPLCGRLCHDGRSFCCRREFRRRLVGFFSLLDDLEPRLLLFLGEVV